MTCYLGIEVTALDVANHLNVDIADVESYEGSNLQREINARLDTNVAVLCSTPDTMLYDCLLIIYFPAMARENPHWHTIRDTYEYNIPNISDENANILNNHYIRLSGLRGIPLTLSVVYVANR